MNDDYTEIVSPLLKKGMGILLAFGQWDGLSIGFWNACRAFEYTSLQKWEEVLQQVLKSLFNDNFATFTTN